MTGTARTFVGESLRFDNPFVRRFAFALVVSVGLAGVVAYARGLEEEETLAGPAVTGAEDPDPGDGTVGTCPPNFPIQMGVKLEDKADKNGDHIVCTDEEGKRVVDNDFFGDQKGPSKVTGHGNFFDGGKKLVQDISFSFNGINTGDGSKGFADTAKGEFEYHDQTGQGPDLTVHGDVLCVSTSGNTARVIGRVTRSNDALLPEGTAVLWLAEDNGEGINEPVDRVTRLHPIGNILPKDPCRAKFPEPPPTRLIASGNIQVQ
jgi:hypothetical protein